MKQKFLKNPLLLFLIGIIMASCELQEEAIHQHEHNSNLKLYEMKFEELMTNKKFVNSFSKLPKSKKNLTTATLGRTVMENDYGFTIANKPAKVIENNGEISYTFLITRDATDADSFENLVIQTDSSNTTKAVIMKYNLTSPITRSADDSYSFTYNREITPIVYNNTTVSETSKMVLDCFWISVVCCNWGGHEHIAGENCTQTYFTTHQECYSFDDGMPEGGGRGSSYNGGSGGTGGPNTITTSPVNNCITGNCIDENTIDPCEKLKNLFNTPNPDIKSTIQNNLQTDIATNPHGEKAAYLQKLPDGTMGTTVSAPTTTNNVKIRIGTNYYSAIHTHPNDCYPMFSYSDVVGLNNINNNLEPHNEGLASFMLVCQDEGVFQTYAIVFETSELNNSIDYFLNTPENSGCSQDEVKAEIDILLGEEFANDSNYERVFLKFMAHTNVSIYKANSELTNWNKLTLGRGFNNAVNSTPCN